jgi:hypothetical protein
MADAPVTKAQLDAALDAKATDLLERTEKVETTLLREFRKWAISFESPFRAHELLIGSFNERLIDLCTARFAGPSLCCLQRK